MTQAQPPVARGRKATLCGNLVLNAQVRVQGISMQRPNQSRSVDKRKTLASLERKTRRIGTKAKQRKPDFRLV